MLIYIRQPVIAAPCQPLTAGWDVRGLLFTLMKTHCGIVPLILFPALWIKNTLWLTLHTLWPFESWQGRERHVCHVKSPPVSAAEGPSRRESTFELISPSNLIQCLLWETSSIYLSLVMCSLGDFGALDQHPRLFKSTDSLHTDWVSYSRVPK